jgi:beta-xylosidase
LQDPYILVYSRRYYLFGTVSPSDGFQCYESADLVNWKLDGWAWRRTPMRAAQGELHSPQVVIYQGMFCLIYSARMATGNHLALAASTHPEGPYHDLHVPWLSLGDSCTSGDLFIDDNGKPYLTFTKRIQGVGSPSCAIYGVALNKDLSKTVGEPVKLLEPTQRWELAHRDQVRYNQSPRMFKISGRYYLSYSANDPLSADCAIGYARADKPLGPWTKAAENPLLAGRPNQTPVGLGQGSVFRSLDGSERFLVYSALEDPANPTGYRVVNIDRLVPQESRKLSVPGPTRSPQPLPSMLK